MPLEDHEGPENAEDRGTALLDPIRELAEYRGVLLKPEDELQDCTPDERERLRGLVDVASRLEALTGWTRGQLLDNIGCDQRDPSKLANDPKRIERCTAFLRILLDAASRVDSARFCQAVVKRCARLSKATGLDVDGFKRLLRTGDVNALEYISLGELSTAIRTARIAAKIEDPAIAHGPSPYDGAPLVHLSTPRIDLYVEGKRDVLGERTHASMAAHIETCAACGEEVAVRRSLVNPDVLTRKAGGLRSGVSARARLE